MKSPYLSDIEEQKVESFCQDEILKQAVKKVLLAGIYEAGTLKKGEHDYGKNWVFSYFSMQSNLTDEQLGQRLRATVEAQSILENSFKELEQFTKVAQTQKDKKNQAR